MDFGERLKRAREYAGLSQKALEERSGVSQKTISKIERGDQDGSTEVVQLARACGVSPDWLADATGDMAPIVHRAAQPTATYAALSDAALAVARGFDQLSPECQEHVRSQIELLSSLAKEPGRGRAAQHDIQISTAGGGRHPKKKKNTVR